MAMAMMLSALRSGRAVTLPQNICSKENRPSKVSFIDGSQAKLYHLSLAGSKKEKVPVSTLDAEEPEKYFCFVKFSTQVLISMWKTGATQRLSTTGSMVSPALHHSSAN